MAGDVSGTIIFFTGNTGGVVHTEFFLQRKYLYGLYLYFSIFVNYKT